MLYHHHNHQLWDQLPVSKRPFKCKTVNLLSDISVNHVPPFWICLRFLVSWRLFCKLAEKSIFFYSQPIIELYLHRPLFIRVLVTRVSDLYLLLVSPVANLLYITFCIVIIDISNISLQHGHCTYTYITYYTCLLCKLNTILFCKLSRFVSFICYPFCGSCNRVCIWAMALFR